MVDGEPAQGARIPPHPDFVLLAPAPVTWAHSAPSGIKESVCWGPPPSTSPLKSCEYHALCSRFQELLLLPGESPGPQNLPYSQPSPGPWPEPLDCVAETQGGGHATKSAAYSPQRTISCLHQSVAYATVSLAENFEGTRPTGVVESPPVNTLCPLAGAGSTSGT